MLPGRRINPLGLAVDESGRIVVTDGQNHQVILFDMYLSVELVFGSYGAHPGQFDIPDGVVVTKEGNIFVSDSGNRRVQVFRLVGAPPGRR